MSDTDFILSRLNYVMNKYEGQEALDKIKFLITLWEGVVK